MVTFPAPPLKFRTVSFPQYGFKPRPLNPALPDRPPGLSATSACPRPPPGLTGPSSPGDPPAFVGGVISRPASGRTGDRPGPRVLRSAGFVLPPHPRYYDPIRGSRRLPRISQLGLVIPGRFARRRGLGCRRDRPHFESSSLPCVPLPVRRRE